MFPRLAVPASILAAALVVAIGASPALAQGPGPRTGNLETYRWQFEEQHRVRTAAPFDVPQGLRLNERRAVHAGAFGPRFGAGAGRNR